MASPGEPECQDFEPQKDLDLPKETKDERYYDLEREDKGSGHGRPKSLRFRGSVRGSRSESLLPPENIEDEIKDSDVELSPHVFQENFGLPANPILNDGIELEAIPLNEHVFSDTSVNTTTAGEDGTLGAAEGQEDHDARTGTLAINAEDESDGPQSNENAAQPKGMPD
jgi:hypothetical protein